MKEATKFEQATSLKNVNFEIKSTDSSIKLYSIPIKSFASFFITSFYLAFFFCIISTHSHENYFEELESKIGDAKCPERKFAKILSITQCVTSYTPGKWIWRTVLIANVGFGIFISPKILYYSFKNSNISKKLILTSSISMMMTGALYIPTNIFFDINPPVSENKIPSSHSVLHFGCFVLMTFSMLTWIVTYLMIIVESRKEEGQTKLTSSPNNNFNITITMIVISIISAALAILFLLLFHYSCLNYADGYFAISEYVYFLAGIFLQMDVIMLKDEHNIEISLAKSK